MFRRWLMILLIVCLATPAVALPVTCHNAPVAAAADHGVHHPAPAKVPAAGEHHDCIGCIAPLMAAPMALPVPLPRTLLEVPQGDHGLKLAALAPETPPPRG